MVDDIQIPLSHTKFSWLAAKEGDPVPLGHTKFSWGMPCRDASLALSKMHNDTNDSTEEEPAVKRGFLSAASNVKDVGDVRQFLSNKVPSVLLRASELHSIEDEEKTPYKSKYQAREILKATLAQLTSCEEKLDPDLRETWSDSIARVELMLGNNFVETEELSQGEKFLVSALDRMKHDPSRFESEVRSARHRSRQPPLAL